VSIDGFRWDYLDRFQPPTLMKLAANGVRADALIPQFPSKTFPNHYTIVTGLTLAHHGIISNNMRDKDIPGEFTLSNREVQNDPRWWGASRSGIPRRGKDEKPRRCSGRIGSRDRGRRGTYWTPYDDDMPHAERVKRILDWLRLPEGQRPSFLTLYFSDVDNAGHSQGPDSDDVKQAVMKVDTSLGDVVTGVKQIGLDDRVNYVIVSDHGMSR
jgi:predicted AlkP superfamily pyrophosphatase or phosphodiesterase